MNTPMGDELFRLVKDTNDRVKNLEEAVFPGNGSPPLLSRISTLEARQISDSRRTFINASGVATILASTIAGIIAAISHK